MEVARYRHILLSLKLLLFAVLREAAKINSTNGLFNPEDKIHNIEIRNRMMFAWRTND